MKGGRRKVDLFGPPCVLLICATLEANLNDWVAIDMFNKHGPEAYRPIVEGFLRIPLREKIRCCVAAMTDNTFHVRSASSIVDALDDLVTTRNALTHAHSWFFIEEGKFRIRPKRQRATDHPVHSLSLARCRNYERAVRAFDRLFFAQYDRGRIVANELLEETPAIGERVP
jgi:hypothetical protein